MRLFGLFSRDHDPEESEAEEYNEADGGIERLANRRNADPHANYNGEIQFESGRSLVASTVGKVFNVLQRVMTGDTNNLLLINKKQKEAEISKMIQERYGDLGWRDDLKISFGKSNLGKSILEKMEADGEKVTWFDRLQLAMADFSINSAQADHYLPYANSMTLFDCDPSTAHHEMGHAVDFNADEGRELRKTSSHSELGINGITNNERIASNIAMRFMMPEEREKYVTRLNAFYGTYQGSTLAGYTTWPAFLAALVTTGMSDLSRWLIRATAVMPALGAYTRRIISSLKRNKAENNFFFNPDSETGTDMNPYWDGFEIQKKPTPSWWEKAKSWFVGKDELPKENSVELSTN